MPIMMCSKCKKPAPDSFHDFKEICTCRTKEEWIERSRKKKWMIKIDGKEYDFTGGKENGN